MTFIGRKLRHAANAPSQPLHDYSYPRTGTFSVVFWTLAVKCSADGDRLEDCSTWLARERQNCGLRSLSSYVEQLSWPDSAERRWHRPPCDDVGSQYVDRYGRAMPCRHLYTSTAVLKVICWLTGRQCSWRRIGEIGHRQNKQTLKYLVDRYLIVFHHVEIGKMW